MQGNKKKANKLLELAQDYQNRESEEYSKKAIELYKQSADLGNTTAMSVVAMFYEHGMGVEKNIQKAIKLYESALAGKFDTTDERARVMYLLANCYTGDGNDVNNMKKAIPLYDQAAELGNTNAMCFIADSTYDEHGSEGRDVALLLYKRAAKGGNGHAIGSLIDHYRNENKFGEKDMIELVELCKISADLEYPPAMLFLAMCYRSGDGVKKTIKRPCNCI